jgi:hypothetical protein
MRRIVGLLVLSVLVAACTPEPEPPADVIASIEPTVEESGSPSPDETPSADDSCDGLGLPPARGQITFLSEGRLIGVSPRGLRRTCLADLNSELLSGGPFHNWNAPADRLILAGNLIGPDAAIDPLPPKWHASEWSRPTGASLIRITRDGRLEKRSLEDGSVTDISFLAHHDDVAYHPAGTHLAVSGEAEDGSYGVYITTNVGTEPQLLARGEESRYVDQLVFSEGGRSLYFVADHGKKVHLHRLSLNPPSEGDTGTVQEVEFDTLSVADSISNLVVSPFTPPDAIAWTENGDCAAGQPSRLRSEGTGTIAEPHIPADLMDRSIVPIGFLPSLRLVVHARSTGCSTAQPGEIYVLGRSGAPTFIEDQEVAAASVRLAHGPPPPPPDIEQEVVA